MDTNSHLEAFLGNVSKEKFRISANKLLNECFILKECSDTKTSYYYILNERERFCSYFDLLGYEIVISEELGLVALNNTFGNGRIRLRLIDSIILLFLRLIYFEETKKLSQSDKVIIRVEELYERYRGLKSNRLKKAEMQSALTLLKRYHIIQNLDSDMTNSETRIQIYPSVILAFDTNELNAVYEVSKHKLEQYRKDGDIIDGTYEEETDATSAD